MLSRVRVYALTELSAEEVGAVLRQALEKGPLMSRVTEVIEEPATGDTRYEAGFTVEMTI